MCSFINFQFSLRIIVAIDYFCVISQLLYCLTKALLSNIRDELDHVFFCIDLYFSIEINVTFIHLQNIFPHLLHHFEINRSHLDYE